MGFIGSRSTSESHKFGDGALTGGWLMWDEIEIPTLGRWARSWNRRRMREQSDNVVVGPVPHRNGRRRR